MDFSSLVGVIVAIGAILLGQHLEGGHANTLLNLPAILIVLCGTMGAVIVETPTSILKEAMKLLLWTVSPPPIDNKEAILKLIDWSNMARKEGLLGLEVILETEKDLFTKKGLQLLIDGGEPENIRRILESDLESRESRYVLASKVFESAGGYCPTIGIIGAVLGLIHVMGNLGDPSKLGGGIAVAFVATIYGVALANIIFLPIANRLNRLITKQQEYYNFYIDGFMAIAQGENPKIIELKLSKTI
ncbi:MAG: flagellar motor protein [Gammaproteobacteria bacterium]